MSVDDSKDREPVTLVDELMARLSMMEVTVMTLCAEHHDPARLRSALRRNADAYLEEALFTTLSDAGRRCAEKSLADTLEVTPRRRSPKKGRA